MFSSEYVPCGLMKYRFSLGDLLQSVIDLNALDRDIGRIESYPRTRELRGGSIAALHRRALRDLLEERNRDGRGSNQISQDTSAHQVQHVWEYLLVCRRLESENSGRRNR